ncbi:hypothetical protein HK101_002784 [Irineochytrium annulatum]|nr:hypothetical protein HK101_002784 [Irineochytrium annulatum]
MDDVWDDDADDHLHDRSVAERDWNKLQQEHGNTGYRNAVTEQKEIHVQTGFDEGFVSGARIGRRAGVMLGRISTLMRSDPSNSERLRKTRDAVEAVLKELFVARTFAEGAMEEGALGEVEKRLEVLEGELGATF